jgi:hypothetical protein
VITDAFYQDEVREASSSFLCNVISLLFGGCLESKCIVSKCAVFDFISLW